jgi:hypothetical protein
MRHRNNIAGYYERSMMRDFSHAAGLMEAVRACGFDAAQYLANHGDLRDAGLDQAGCLEHFITCGCREQRNVPAGPRPLGFAALARLPGIESEHRSALLRAIFQGQSAHAGTAAVAWRGIDCETWSICRHSGGLPYVVIGDSHANLYNRFGHTPHGWLAPTLLLCSGGSARGLARETSRSGNGARILAWAAATGATRCAAGLPVFLKFGQVDAEFVWIFDRVRHGIKQYRRAQFLEFASGSVAEYARYLQKLRQVLPRASLHVCSLFPPVLSDAAWHEGYVNAHIGFLEGDRALNELKDGIQSLDVPDLTERTVLHAAYNALLQSACRRLDLNFVNDFQAILSGQPTVDRKYFAASQGHDHHLDYDQTETLITDLIERTLVKRNFLPRAPHQARAFAALLKEKFFLP